MLSYKVLAKEVLLDLLFRLCNPRRDEEGVPVALNKALKECSSLEQVLDLLFVTDFDKDEAILSAFEKRIYEIECSNCKPPF